MNKALILILITAFFIAVPCYGIFANGNTADECYYNYVEIKAGDTLYSIAEDFLSDGRDLKNLVKEIKGFNKMRSDKIIAGEFIFVPVYK